MDLIKFLETGKFVFDLHLRDNISTTDEVIGSPVNIVGDEIVGFRYYENGIRIGYFNNFIDELAICFVDTSGIQFPIVLDDEMVIVSEKTQLHSFIYLLNQAKIKWKVNDEFNLYNFSIVTTANVYIIFDLITGFISMISTGG